MSEIVGRVRFISSLDGRGNARDAERIGKEAGKAGAKGYDEEWTKAFRETLTKSGRESFDRWQKAGSRDGGAYGDVFSKSLDKYVTQGMERAARNVRGIRLEPGFLDDFAKGFRDADEAVEHLREELRLMEGHLDGRMLGAAKRQVDEWAEAQRRAAEETERVAEAQRREEEQTRRTTAALEHRHARMADYSRRMQAWIDESNEAVRAHGDMLAVQREANRETDRSITKHDALTLALDKLDGKVRDHSLRWRDLSHNTRQWTLIIGAVMAAMQDLAVLGSAAGAGLVAVGGGIAALGLGAYATGAVLVNLFQDIEKAPAAMRPVIREFNELRTSIGDVNDAVAQAAFDRMGGSFTRIKDSLTALTPALAGLGSVVGGLIDDFSRATRPGTEGFAEINRLVKNSAPLFDSMMRSAGTLGLALIRAFNEANPLVQDMVGWIDTLIQRFDAFTRSTGFDEWIRNAQRTFGSFGPLLDAVGRSLNDLVTAESVNRTAAFLDNLTAFMPNLTRLLDILGRLDVFGLAAQLLNEMGTALEPLAPAVGDLAEALSGVISDAIPGIAGALGALAKMITPVVQGFADFLDALPPEAIAAIAGSVLLLVGAFRALDVAVGLTTSIQAYTTAAGAATTATGRLGNSLKANLGKAGLVGMAAAGVVALGTAIGAAVREASGFDARAKEAASSSMNLYKAVEHVTGEFEYFGATIDGSTASASELDEAMRHAANSGFSHWGLSMNRAAEASQELIDNAGDVITTVKLMDESIGQAARTNLPAAVEQFHQMTDSAKLTDGQLLNVIKGMDNFESALTEAAIAEDGFATDADLLRLALGKQRDETNKNEVSIKGLGERAILSGDQIDELSAKVRGFTEDALTSRSAQREFEKATDDVTAALAENGATLDITTEQGRNNEAALDDLAQATMDLYDDTLKQKDGQIKANDVMREGRDRLIEALKQFGITGQAAEDYADELGLIPEDIMTEVELRGVQEAEQRIKDLTKQRSVTIYAAVGGWTPGVDRPMASGGILNGPTRVLAGEAGREAFVPLERPLSQVDPSVRWLAAIAQGKATPAMASGGTVGGGGGPVFTEGAIVVNDRSGDSRRTANEVLTRVIENVAG